MANPLYLQYALDQQSADQQAAMRTQQLQAAADMQGAREYAQSQLVNQEAANDIWKQQQMDQWLMQQAWTSADEANLSKAKAGLSQVQADPSLSGDPDALAAAVAQYQPYISKMEARKQLSDLRMQKAQQDHLNAQTANLNAHNMTGQTAFMKAFPNMIHRSQQDDGSYIEYAPDGKGGVHATHVKNERDRAGEAEQKRKDAAEKNELAHQDKDRAYWYKANSDAIAQATKERTETVPVPPDAPPGTKPQLKYPNMQADEVFNAQVNQYRKLRGANTGTPEEHVENKKRERAGQSGTSPGSTAPSATPAEKKAEASEPPFQFYSDEPKTDEQKKQIANFEEMRRLGGEAFGRGPIVSQGQKLYNDELKKAQDILERYGSVTGMPEDQHKEYTGAILKAKAMKDAASKIPVRPAPSKIPVRPAPSNMPYGLPQGTYR